MTTETEVVAPVVEVVEAEVSPIEQEALDQGWMPKEKWVESGKNPDDWRGAKEFKERGEFFKVINSLKRDQKQTKAAHDALVRHHQYVFEKARIQAIDDLKKERRQAMRNEDLDRVEQIEDQIEKEQSQFAQERAQLAASQQAAAQAGPPAEFEAWKSTNTWYDTNQELREYADDVGIAYIARYPTAKPDEVLKVIDTKMRKQFPDKFGARRASPSPTAVADKTTRVSKRTDDVTLTDLEQEIMQTLVKSGDMTEAQYKAEIKKARG
jgi:hypothetical protein